MTGLVWAGLLFQILAVCVFGMLLWFWLLTVYPASQLGVLLLDEPVEPRFILGAALVLAGIVLVSGWRWFARIGFACTQNTRDIPS